MLISREGVIRNKFMEKEQEKRNQSYRLGISRAGKRGERTKRICDEELVAMGLKLMNENMEQEGPEEIREEDGGDVGGEWEESAKKKRKQRTIEVAKKKKLKKKMDGDRQSKEEVEEDKAPLAFETSKIGGDAEDQAVGGNGSTSKSSGEGEISGEGGKQQQLTVSPSQSRKKRKRRTREELEKERGLEVEEEWRKEKRLANAIRRAKRKMRQLSKDCSRAKILEESSASSLFKRKKVGGDGAEEDVVGGKENEGSSTSSGDGGGEMRLLPNKVKIFVSEKSRMDGILKEMETGPAVPVYPQRALAVVLPKPVQRPRPVMKEIGIQVSLASQAIVPWAPVNSRSATVPALASPPVSRELISTSQKMVMGTTTPNTPTSSTQAILPPPPATPSISQQLALMPPPPPPPPRIQMQSMFLPTSPWSRIFQSTAAPPIPSTAITPFRQSPQHQAVPPGYMPPPTSSAISTSNQLVPVDPRSQSEAITPPPPPPKTNQDKEDEEVLILEPNEPPAWNLRKICFPNSRSSRTSSLKEQPSRRSRSTHTSRSSSKSSSRHRKRYSCGARSSDKLRTFRRHSSSRKCRSYRKSKSPCKRRSSSRTSRSPRHSKANGGGTLTPAAVLTYSDSPAEPVRESDPCPSTSNPVVVKRCPKSDVKGWTKIADYSKRQWPQPMEESGSHPIRTINCYHVLREKKRVPLVDLTGSSSPRGRNASEDWKINYTPL